MDTFTERLQRSLFSLPIYLPLFEANDLLLAYRISCQLLLPIEININNDSNYCFAIRIYVGLT